MEEEETRTENDLIINHYFWGNKHPSQELMKMI